MNKSSKKVQAKVRDGVYRNLEQAYRDGYTAIAPQTTAEIDINTPFVLVEKEQLIILLEDCRNRVAFDNEFVNRRNDELYKRIVVMLEKLNADNLR